MSVQGGTMELSGAGRSWQELAGTGWSWLELVGAGEELARNQPKRTLKADSFRNFEFDMTGVVSENVLFADMT